MSRIDLHLRVRVKPGGRGPFLAFLHEAIPFYERPGGIRIMLFQDIADDHRFVELVSYRDRAAYEQDQIRVASDPDMKRFLERWRSLLAEPPVVETYELTQVS